MSKRQHEGNGELSAPRALDEVITSYTGEWVLLRVTAFDELRAPAQGEVLAHSPSRKRVSKVLAGQPPRSSLPADVPHAPYYLFHAFPRVRSREGLRKALEEAAQQEDWVKLRPW